MRFLIERTTATLLLIGAAAVGTTPAFADDIFFNHAAGTMSGGAAATDSQSAARAQPYMQVEPRDAKVATQTGDDVEGNTIFYNHAAGTMSGNPVDTASSAADQNGRYVASYHQYMQMDPRDLKAIHKQDGVDNNIFFNHAQGTMSGN